MTDKIVALAIFIAAYAAFVFFPNRRTAIVGYASLFLLIAGTISLKDVFNAINWNVMGIFVGTLLVADVFMESRVPAYIAESIVKRSRNTGWAVLFICLLTSAISALIENVATVLIMAPIAISLARKTKINPINVMIAVAISSNLQGSATLIGDPPSMLLGGFAKMNFMDFICYKGKPGIFFAVELGALASFFVLYLMFKRHREKIELEHLEKVNSWFPTSLLISLVISLAVSSLFDAAFSYFAGVICVIAGLVAIVWKKFVKKSSLIEGIKALDWDTAFFLMGIFILVGSITLTGWIEVVSELISKSVGGNIFLGYTLIVWLAVILSAFVDNVPFLAAMLPVAISVSNELHMEPSLLLFGLLAGSSLGGNITPIGASANIVACGLLKKEGYQVSFKDFFKIGFPFTMVAITAAYLFIWFVWGI